jgi:TRAP-type C4-dicarboxylate transport system substrate-binding protein
VLQGAAGRKVLNSLNAAGMQGLAFGENGFRHLTNNKRAVVKAQDLKGLRVRVMESALQKELWQRLGATPVPHPWPIEDLLAKGGADGQENPLWVIWLYRLDKLQKHLTLTGHVYSAHICAANLAWFQSLPLSEQKMLSKAMKQAAAYQRDLNRKNEQKALGRLKAAGMQAVDKPDLASFKKKLGGLAESALFSAPGLKQLLDECRQTLKKP